MRRQASTNLRTRSSFDCARGASLCGAGFRAHAPPRPLARKTPAPHVPNDPLRHIEQRRNRGPLRGSLPLPTRSVRPAATAPTVVLLHRHLQPRLDPAQQPPVAHAAGDGPEQVGVRNLAVVVRQVGVHHLPMARRQQPVHAPDRVMRAPARPIGVLLRLQVGLEDRRQHQHRRRLRHPVPETRNAQRPELPTLLLRDEDLPNRSWPVGPRLQVPRQRPQPPVHPERLDVRDRLAVHPGRAAVAADGLPGDREHVLAPHLVAQRVEPEAWGSLRFRM